MTKEIKIGDKVFKEGQTVNYIIKEPKQEFIPIFFKIDKICPKIVKLRPIYWVTYNEIPRWEYGLQRYVTHKQLASFLPASKVNLDNHVYYCESFYNY